MVLSVFLPYTNPFSIVLHRRHPLPLFHPRSSSFMSLSPIFCVFVHLSSVKFTPHFILEEGPHFARPPFFFSLSVTDVHRQRSAHLFHFRHFIFTFKSFILSLFFFLSPISRIPYISVDFIFNVSLSSVHFLIFIFFLFSLAHQSYTPRRTSHSFSFNSFIQPRSNTSFNSIHLIHSFFIRTPSVVIALPSCW